MAIAKDADDTDEVDALYDVANEVAHDLFARTRGNVRGQLPDYLLLAWEDLHDDQRALYVEMAKAGIERERNV